MDKICPKCRIPKEVKEFASAAGRVSGLQAYCRKCCRQIAIDRKLRNPEEFKKTVAENARRWRKKNPTKVLTQNLKQKYGISLEFFDEMVLKQGGVCAICDVPLLVVCVDHCHETGKVRGLLCSLCNIGLGGFKDSPKKLLAAVEYLKGSNG